MSEERVLHSSDGPTFLCIGAGKAGTTWLWDNLRLHSEVWVPPIKELHWFDVLYPPDEMLGRPDYTHRRGLRRYFPLVRKPSLQRLQWLRQFYSSLEARQGYTDLFPRFPKPIKGEITPAYAILDRRAVGIVKNTVPADCRVIFIMREPVDRLWSSLRMHCRNHGVSIKALSDSELFEMSRQPEHVLRSDYMRTIENWSVFGDMLGLFFYEDLKQDPAAFLGRILRFLGADPTWHSPALHQLSNVGETSRPPSDALLDRWRTALRPVVEGVAGRLGHLPVEWRY